MADLNHREMDRLIVTHESDLHAAGAKDQRHGQPYPLPLPDHNHHVPHHARVRRHRWHASGQASWRLALHAEPHGLAHALQLMDTGARGLAQPIACNANAEISIWS
jgi:hypothetical protein